MADFSTATARKIVLSCLEHEMWSVFDTLVVGSRRNALELAPSWPKAPAFTTAGVKTSEFRIEHAQRLAYTVAPTPTVAPDPGRVGEVFLSHLLDDSDFVNAMKVLLDSGVSADETITSEEASQLLGFSRTYTNALLDSEEFAGKVTRTLGGHRRVSKKAVHEWKRLNGVPMRGDVGRARQELRAELSVEATSIELLSTSGEVELTHTASERRTKMRQARERVLANRVERP